MSTHDHITRVEGCHRCDLGRDEAGSGDIIEQTVIHLSDPETGPSYCGEKVTLLEPAGDTRPVCQACHRGAMKRVRRMVDEYRNEAVDLREPPTRDEIARVMEKKHFVEPLGDADHHHGCACGGWDNSWDCDETWDEHYADAVLALIERRES